MPALWGKCDYEDLGMNTYLTRSQAIGALGEKTWTALERERAEKAQAVGLPAKNGKPFWMVLVPEVLSLISAISQDKGFLSSLKLSSVSVLALSTSALKQEAYYSSRIEGAVTSLEAALRNMDRKKKDFADESMQMIYNNKLALEFMHKHKADPFTHERIHGLHKILVYNTHKDRPITVGQYRKGPIYVVDGHGRVVYEGPPAGEVPGMMDRFMEWMNRETGIHPLVNAALVHLYFVHVHPFDDGNGRSARALSNLYLEKQGYGFINLLAPSDYFEHHKAAYYKSIQAAEEHSYDATYFVLYYLEALKDQLVRVKAQLEKEGKIKDIKQVLGQTTWARLAKKHVKALRWMMESGEWITTRKYCKLNRCSDETARKDFIHLMKLGLLTAEGSGRSTAYAICLKKRRTDSH